MVFLAECGLIVGEKMYWWQTTCSRIQHGVLEEGLLYITGRSVHNCRIERLWKDVFQSCTILYFNIFCHLEELQELSVDDEVHLFCLHYVFLPKINISLRRFMQAWNSHPMQSENGLSPEQLWLRSMAEYQGHSIQVHVHY